MGILDKLKGKKAEAPKADVAQDLKTETATASKAAQTPAMFGGAQILVRPLLSEKGTHFAASGKYVFIVNRKANKPEIKKSIQKIYNVHVEDVKIINLPSKKRRYGMTSGETSAFKKAIVVLRSGEKIPGIIESVG